MAGTQVSGRLPASLVNWNGEGPTYTDAASLALAT
jgi:hypothetical protein